MLPISDRRQSVTACGEKAIDARCAILSAKTTAMEWIVIRALPIARTNRPVMLSDKLREAMRRKHYSFADGGGVSGAGAAVSEVASPGGVTGFGRAGQYCGVPVRFGDLSGARGRSRADVAAGWDGQALTGRGDGLGLAIRFPGGVVAAGWDHQVCLPVISTGGTSGMS